MRQGSKKANSPETRILAVSSSSIGAGASMSLGKKMRALTATNATKKTMTIKKGITYSRKKLMAIAKLGKV